MSESGKSEGQLLDPVKAQAALAALRKQLAQKDAELEREMEARRQLEQALHEAEQSGHSLVENLSEVIYTTDAQGVLTYISPAIERSLGHRASEVIGRHISEFIYQEDLPELTDRFRYVASGQDLTSEYRAVTKSGEIRWMRISSQPVFEGDRVVGAQGVLTDITERKLAEEQFRTQNQFLVSILESLTHPFYVLDVHDYTIRMANSAARLGSLGAASTCYALTHRRDAPCDTADHPCPVEEIKRTKAPTTVEHIHYDQDGKARHVEVHGYPLFDDDGNVSQVIEYSFDVTERNQVEEALREGEARWRSVTENSPDHVILLDTDLRIQFVNYASPGLTVEELIGTPLYTLVAEKRQAEIRQILESVLTTAEPAAYETEYQIPDGGTLYYESRVLPRVVDDRVVGLAVNARDITERRQAEQALQKSETLLNVTQQMAKLGGWELDLRTSQVTWTDEVYRIHEVPPEFEPTLDNALEFYHPQDRPVLQQAIQRATEAGEPWDLELRFITATGKLLWVRAIGKAERQDGDVVRLSGTFQDITERKQAEQALQEAAAADERNRLARDLHDSVTQALFSASLVAEVLPQVWQRDPSAAQEGLYELRLLTRSALAEMRTMLLELRPTALVETPLNELLWQLTEASTSRAQLLVTFNIEPSPKLPPDVHVTFYRVAQEALNNVVKHAEASLVTVGLTASPPVSSPKADGWRGQVTLQISDDGQGFDPGDTQPEQLGLGIMRERADGISAGLEIESRLGWGTTVTLVWPKG